MSEGEPLILQGIEAQPSEAQLRRFLARRLATGLWRVLGWLLLGFAALAVLKKGFSPNLIAESLLPLALLLVGLLVLHRVLVWLQARQLVRAGAFPPLAFRFDDEAASYRGAQGLTARIPYDWIAAVSSDTSGLQLRMRGGAFLIVPFAGFGEPPERIEAFVRERVAAAQSLNPSGRVSERDGKEPGAVQLEAFATKGWAHDCLVNLRFGGAALLLSRLPSSGPRASSTQLVVLSLVWLGIEALSDWLLISGPAEASGYGLLHWSWLLVSLSAAAWAISRLHGRERLLLPLLVALLSLMPWFVVLSGVLDWASWQIDFIDQYWQSLIIGFYLWLLFAAARTLRHLVEPSARRTLPATALLLAVFVLPLWLLPTGEFWYEAYEPAPERPRIDVEHTYYQQPQLMRDALAAVRPGTPGAIDLFALTFGADASQAVFKRESDTILKIVDRRLGSAGHSLRLVNHRDTLDAFPLASISNLDMALRAFAERMQPNEDLALLYLTAHGARDKRLAIRFRPLRLNTLSAKELRERLDQAGIRWRIIIISACYSGGLIPELADENSLIITAAAADRTSFGCSNERDYTYFGEALFRDALAQTDDLPEAFRIARVAVDARERGEGLTPSLPQMHLGDAMREQLRRWRAQLNRE